MIKGFQILVLFVSLIWVKNVFSQETLVISKQKLFKTKRYEVFTGEILEYKLKGNTHYLKNKIAIMQDSMVVFTNDSVVFLNQIKKIKLSQSNFLIRLTSSAFKAFGTIFLITNSINNISSPKNIANEQVVAWVGGSFLAGELIRQIGIKRINTKTRCYLKIIKPI